MENDALKNAALWFQTVEGKRFRLTVKRKQETQNLTIYFPVEAFYHLAGLHKLKDIPMIRRSAKTVYREIIEGKITYHTIESSAYIDEIKDRLNYLSQIAVLMKADSLYFKSLHGRFKGITASFVLTNKIDDTQFAFLFFAPGNPDYCPCSFFNRNEQREYTKEGTRWTITDIREIG